MDRDYQKTLFFPFERGEIAAPTAGRNVLIIGAKYSPELPEAWAAQTRWVQGFRPDILALRRAGLDVAPELTGTGYDAVLILCGRHRGQNEIWLVEALSRCRPEGFVMVAGGKNEGMDSLRKWVAGSVPIEGSMSKYHGMVFWMHRPASLPSGLVCGAKNELVRNADGFFSAPAMFAHRNADAGSGLLAATLPPGLTGDAADFGAGWGYLSVRLLQSSPKISSLDLYEADYASLQAARRNVEPLASGTRPAFFWIDLLQEKVDRKYDLIVMNPPFHTGRAAEPGIGTGMIMAAAAALKPGGRLFMVANRNLPYEKTIAASFAHHSEICAEGGYKVIHARR